MKVTVVLKNDHAAVKRLFARFRQTTDRAGKTRQDLVTRLATELEVHAQVEEEIFYPAMREVPKATKLLKEAHEEHKAVKALVAQMQSEDEPDALASTVDELREAVLHHATEEERAMFRLAEQLGREKLLDLGEELQARKLQLKRGFVGRAKRGFKRAIRRAA
jgi:hemerythrin superfamily protein